MNTIKKHILTGIFTFFPVLAFSQCITPTQKDFVKLSLSIVYQNNTSLYEILNKKCIDFTYTQNWSDIGWVDSPLMSSNNFNQFKQILETTKYSNDKLNTQYSQIFTKQNLLVSRMILGSLSNKKLASIKKDIESFQKDFPEVKGSYTDFNAEENKKIIIYLANIYSQSFTTFFDKFNNSPLSYAILTNNSEIFNKTFSQVDGTNALFRINKNGITPMHLLFSSDLKNKDVSKLNDIVLSKINLQNLLYLNFKNVDYFQYIEIFKNNNPDLYKKLKQKLKFSVVLNDVTINNILNSNHILNAPSDYLSYYISLL